MLAGVEGVSFTYFTSGDVVRHVLVQRIVDAYQRFEAGGFRNQMAGDSGPALDLEIQLVTDECALPAGADFATWIRAALNGGAEAEVGQGRWRRLDPPAGWS